MSFLAFIFAVELGWLPAGGFAAYQAPEFIEPAGSFYTDLQAGVVAWNHFYITGGLKTYAWKQGTEWTFWPHSTLYDFGAGLLWGPVQVGWRHFCFHPVMPCSILYDAELKAEGAWDEVFVKVNVKVGGR
jgi:hypothetical protein